MHYSGGKHTVSLCKSDSPVPRGTFSNVALLQFLFTRSWTNNKVNFEATHSHTLLHLP